MKKIKQLLLTIIASITIVAYGNVTADDTKQYTVEHIGTATVILKYGDLTIMTDPAFDKAGSTYDMGFATLKKLSDPARSINELPKIDLVLLSHDQHPDNLDTAGRKLLKKSAVTITTEEGAKRIENNTVGLAWWESHKIGDVTITAVPAQHGPAQAVPQLGTVIGFIISSATGPTIYISGDTVPFEGTDEIIKRYVGKIDYALVHAGSVAKGKTELTYFTMTSANAINLVDKLDVSKFSIIHADSWEHFRELAPAALKAVRASSVADRLIDLKSGVHNFFSK